jgi:hypothetical protein
MLTEGGKAANEANLPGLGYQQRKGRKKFPSTRYNSVGGQQGRTFQTRLGVTVTVSAGWHKKRSRHGI